jgi:hypothetical protein
VCFLGLIFEKFKNIFLNFQSVKFFARMTSAAALAARPSVGTGGAVKGLGRK